MGFEEIFPLLVLPVMIFAIISGLRNKTEDMRHRAVQRSAQAVSAEFENLSRDRLLAELPASAQSEDILQEAAALRDALPQPDRSEARALRHGARVLVARALRAGGRPEIAAAAAALSAVCRDTDGSDPVPDLLRNLRRTQTRLDHRFAAVMAMAEGVALGGTPEDLSQLLQQAGVQGTPIERAVYDWLAKHLPSRIADSDWPRPASADTRCPEGPASLVVADLYWVLGAPDLSMEVRLNAVERLSQDPGARHPVTVLARWSAAHAALLAGRRELAPGLMAPVAAGYLGYARAPLARPGEAGRRADVLVQAADRLLTEGVEGLLRLVLLDEARSTCLWMRDLAEELQGDLTERAYRKLGNRIDAALRKVARTEEDIAAPPSPPVTDALDTTVPPFVSRLEPGEAEAMTVAALSLTEATRVLQKGAPGLTALRAAWERVERDGSAAERLMVLQGVEKVLRKHDGAIRAKTMLETHYVAMERCFGASAPEATAARHLLAEHLWAEASANAKAQVVALDQARLARIAEAEGEDSKAWQTASRQMMHTLSRAEDPQAAAALQARRIAAMTAARDVASTELAREQARLGQLRQAAGDGEGAAKAYGAAVDTYRAAEPTETALEAAEQVLYTTAAWLIAAGRREEARDALLAAQATFALYEDDPIYGEGRLEEVEALLEEEFGIFPDRSVDET